MLPITKAVYILCWQLITQISGIIEYPIGYRYTHTILRKESVPSALVSLCVLTRQTCQNQTFGKPVEHTIVSHFYDRGVTKLIPAESAEALLQPTLDNKNNMARDGNRNMYLIEGMKDRKHVQPNERYLVDITLPNKLT